MSDGFDLLKAKRRVFESGLRSTEKLTALALLDHWSRDEPAVFPSVERLARWTSLGRCAVMRAVAGLELAGAIRPNRRLGAKTTYDLTPLMSLPVSEEDQSLSKTGLPERPNQSLSKTATSLPERHEVTHRSNPEKKPTTARPTPSSPTEGAPKRNRKAKTSTPISLPADWRPTEAHRAYAAKHGLDLELEVDGFRGWAQDRTQVSWDGTFTTRLANQAKWNRERSKNGSRRAPVQLGVANEAEAATWGRGAQAQAMLGGIE